MHGHTGRVTSMLWAPNMCSLVSGSWVGEDGAVEIGARQVLRSHTNRVAAVVWAPDGGSLVPGSWDGTVRAWTVNKRGALGGSASLARLVDNGHVLSVAWSPDKRSVASGYEDRIVQVWPVGVDGLVERSDPHDAAMRVWRAGEDRTVDIIATQVLKGHTDDVTSVTWAPGGRFLASGSADSIVRVCLTCFVETQRCYVASMALAGHMSMRPYQHIVIQISATSQIDADICYITVSNIDIRCASLARRSCRALAPCPPKRAAAKGSAPLVLTCTCDTSPTEAWGDAACDVPVTQLDNGAQVTSVQAEGRWSFYVLKAPEGSNMLPVVNDPVLFVKHRDDGFPAGGLAVLMDYEV
eukprot:jgi/Tetstr1/435817/TSEL_024705.t1